MQNGNALFHRMTDSCTVPATFREIALQLLNVMIIGKALIFLTDCYSECCIKAQEKIRRKQQLSRMLLQVWSSDDAMSRTGC